MGVTTKCTESTKRGRSRRLQPSSSYPHTYGLGWFWKATNTWEEEDVLATECTKSTEGMRGIDHERHGKHERGRERLIEDNSPYRLRGKMAVAGRDERPRSSADGWAWWTAECHQNFGRKNILTQRRKAAKERGRW